MKKRINLSEISGVELMSVETFNAKALLALLLEDPIASQYPKLSELNDENMDMYDFFGWEAGFTEFMSQHDVMVFIA